MSSTKNIAIILFATSLSCAPASSPKEELAQPEAVVLEKVRIGIAIPSYVHALAWVGKDAGIFEKNGLDVEVVQLKGSSSTMRTLLSDDLHMGLAGGDAAVKATVAGGDLVLVGGVVNKPYHRLVGVPEILEPKDLRGRSIGLPFLGGPQDMVVKFALKRFGLTYNEDVTVKNMGAEYARLVALQKGDVDVVTSAAPPSKVEEMGFRIIADMPTWDVAFPYMQMVVRKSRLDSNRPVVKKLVKSVSESMAYYRDHPEESLTILKEHLGEDKGNPKEAYTVQGPGLYTWPPKPDTNGLQTVIDFLGESDEKYDGLTAGSFIDTSLLDELEAEGIFATTGKDVE